MCQVYATAHSQLHEIPSEENVRFNKGYAVDDTGNSRNGGHNDCVETLRILLMVVLETVSVNPPNRKSEYKLQKADYDASDDGNHCLGEL